MDKAKAIEIVEILDALIAIQEISIIKNTFVSAFLNKSIKKPDGKYYLHGNFNATGTVSARMSSSKVNLQNLPSTGSRFAKPVKECFVAPKGYLLMGADFNALEARVGALLTKDPAKMRVYTEGLDSHCMNCYSYWPEQMPDIDPNSTESINSIADKYPELRQKSKTITFAAQYGGTFKTFMDNGFTESEAKQVEANYKKLYQHSIDWVNTRIEKATSTGYVDCAFGLKLRTPILKQVILNNKRTPYEATAEARTAGNAMQQSYGLLNNRAAIEMQQRILASPYKLDIRPIAAIHDSQYFFLKDNIDVVHWFNINLVECMEWQELPEIYHEGVHLGAETEIYYPSWCNAITLPNNASKEEIRAIAAKHK